MTGPRREWENHASLKILSNHLDLDERLRRLDKGRKEVISMESWILKFEVDGSLAHPHPHPVHHSLHRHLPILAVVVLKELMLLKMLKRKIEKLERLHLKSSFWS